MSSWKLCTEGREGTQKQRKQQGKPQDQISPVPPKWKVLGAHQNTRTLHFFPPFKVGLVLKVNNCQGVCLPPNTKAFLLVPKVLQLFFEDRCLAEALPAHGLIFLLNKLAFYLEE